MNTKILLSRTKAFSLRIIKLVSSLPNNPCGQVFARQLVKSGTSIGANYREALRASSKRHFTTIIEIAEREADETLYWLELLAESALVRPARLTDLIKECKELLSIMAATAVSSKRSSKPPLQSKIINQKS